MLEFYLQEFNHAFVILKIRRLVLRLLLEFVIESCNIFYNINDYNLKLEVSIISSIKVNVVIVILDILITMLYFGIRASRSQT